MPHVSEPSIRRDPRAIALMIAASMTVMTAATISPALPGLEAQFGQDAYDAFLVRVLVRVLVPAPSLAALLVTPFCGLAADRSGRRPMLLGGLVLFILAGTAGLFLPTLTLIMASRLCLGVALAMILTAQSALLGDYFSGRALHAVSSGQVSARNFGGFVFIILAGGLATLGARLPFMVYALPALALPFFWRVIVEPVRNPPTALRPSQSVPRLVIALALGQMAVTVVFFVIPTQLPFFLAVRGHASPALSGAALGTLMLSGGVAALCYPWLRGAIDNMLNWSCGFGLMACGFASLIAIDAKAAVFIGCAAIGAGYALAIPGFVALSMAAAPSTSRGRAAALLTGSVFLGQFLSPLLSTPAIAIWGWNNSGFGLVVALVGVAILCALVPYITARVRRHP